MSASESMISGAGGVSRVNRAPLVSGQVVGSGCGRVRVPMTAEAMKAWTEQVNRRRPALEAAFEQVRSARHWKEPIDAYCRCEDRVVVAEAIEFFTATVASFYVCGVDGWCRVKAAGYRAGPAGDH